MVPPSRICLRFSVENKEISLMGNAVIMAGLCKAQIAPNYAQPLQAPKPPQAGTLFHIWEINTKGYLNQKEPAGHIRNRKVTRRQRCLTVALWQQPRSPWLRGGLATKSQSCRDRVRRALSHWEVGWEGGPNEHCRILSQPFFVEKTLEKVTAFAKELVSKSCCHRPGGTTMPDCPCPALLAQDPMPAPGAVSPCPIRASHQLSTALPSHGPSHPDPASACPQGGAWWPGLPQCPRLQLPWLGW